MDLTKFYLVAFIFYMIFIKYNPRTTINQEVKVKNIILSAILLTIYVCVISIEDLRKTCAACDAKSCKILGDLTRSGLGVEQNNNQAQKYYDRACFDGFKDACTVLEIMKNNHS